MSLWLLIGLRHLKLCMQLVCTSLSPACCTPPPRWIRSLGWHPGSLGCNGEQELPALLNRRDIPAFSPCLWLLLGRSNQVMQLIKLYLARKGAKRSQEKGQHKSHMPGGQILHRGKSATSGCLLWSSPGTGPQALGLLGISSATSPTVAIVAAFHPQLQSYIKK